MDHRPDGCPGAGEHGGDLVVGQVRVVPQHHGGALSVAQSLERLEEQDPVLGLLELMAVRRIHQAGHCSADDGGVPPTAAMFVDDGTADVVRRVNDPVHASGGKPREDRLDQVVGLGDLAARQQIGEPDQGRPVLGRELSQVVDPCRVASFDLPHTL